MLENFKLLKQGKIKLFLIDTLKLIPVIVLALAFNFGLYILWCLSHDGWVPNITFEFAVSIIMSIYIIFFMKKSFLYRFLFQIITILIILTWYYFSGN